MHSMLKKSLLAMTVAAAAVGSVQAQTIGFTQSVVNPTTGTTINPTIISAEGLATEADVTIGTDITATFTLSATAGANANSIVRILVGGGTVNAATTAPVLTNNTDGTVVFNPLGQDSESGAFLFSSSSPISAGDELELSGVSLASASVGASITVQANTSVPGTDITTNSTPTTAIATISSQFAIANGTDFDGVIDVAQARTQFVVGGEGPTLDTFDITLSDNNSDVFNTTIASGSTLSVTGGDLSFLNTVNAQDEVVLDSARFTIGGTGLITTGTSAPALVDNTLTGTYDATVIGALSVAFIPEGITGTEPAQLNAQSFTADVSVNYTGPTTGTGTFVQEDINAGGWSLSGSTVNIPFIPFGNNFAQVIRISNDGAVDGEIELTAFDDQGEQFGPVTLDVTAAPGAVTNVLPSIVSALDAEGFDGAGDLDITLIINSPSGDITGSANYRVLSANDRVGVIVTSN